MVKHQCPHCGGGGISGFRRAFLGPALPGRCSCCGAKVGVPWWSLLMLLPFWIALVLAGFVRDSGFASFWLGAFGGLSTVLLWDGMVPLVKR